MVFEQLHYSLAYRCFTNASTRKLWHKAIKEPNAKETIVTLTDFLNLILILLKLVLILLKSICIFLNMFPGLLLWLGE